VTFLGFVCSLFDLIVFSACGLTIKHQDFVRDKRNVLVTYR
jgi:hypothetical protein